MKWAALLAALAVASTALVVQDDEVARLRAELEAVRAELASTRAELEQLQRRRAEREIEWLEYNRGLALLDLDRWVPPFPIDPEYEPSTVDPGDGPGEVALSPEEELELQLAERAEAILLTLRTMLRVEEVTGLDLLEVGRVAPGGVGPVVFRLLDGRGRLTGGLTAEHLRLEASVTARTLTLVLENGFESHGGERTPFRGGIRRIVVPYVDPRPYVEALPELFPAGQDRRLLDDGGWPLARVRTDLNALLRGATGGGWWRLRHLDGVRAGVLVGVHLEAYDAEGRLERRLFADAMELALDGDAVRIELTDGVVVRGASRTPFQGGVYRIYLPRADVAAWTAAELPGLSGGAGGSPAEGDGPASGGDR